MLNLILAQVLTLVVQAYIANTKSQRRVFVATCLFNFANMFCYYLNGDMTTVWLYVVICVRSVAYVAREELKPRRLSWLIPATFIAIQLAVGLVSMDSPWQIMPTLIPCYTIYYLWYYESLQKLRVGNMVANAAWMAYNLVTGLYIIALGRLATVVLNADAYRRNRTATGGDGDDTGDDSDTDGNSETPVGAA